MAVGPVEVVGVGGGGVAGVRPGPGALVGLGGLRGVLPLVAQGVRWEGVAQQGRGDPVGRGVVLGVLVLVLVGG